ncbi:MAG TPA: manganese efflux pump MntP family protein [Acidobacteriota bacterium]|nr:manganese efflux pump MntP family protein [Acidobacteriota bacterium]HNT17724.1 manganese efflux pump MntP family protein [Acidobacteriota bacterium]HPA27846.1 manganese efflux pump MntP family protein [Acidobacteriota bacterium]HQO19082.1 manganese efflux pump MntP family protein [Acidobacteriota bacterium]HQQ47810.1 manganese efflux pump MntP family protein [Acidobacteriota bacterium]
MDMPVLQVVLIAVALSMDAFAVSISSGIVIGKMRVRHALLIASFFGVFQAVMPFLGWEAGRGLRRILMNYDHWAAFILLLAVGVKMIWDSLKKDADEKPFDPLNIYVLFILAIATSIDALAVGIALSFAGVNIVLPVIIIGCVTFAMSFAGTYVGSIFGHMLESKVEMAAGILLIGIGVKILVQHTLG